MHNKTTGNPFFAIQFISALSQEGLLTFDHVKGEWSWDLNRIHTKGYTDNVVDLMVGKLNRLSAETQNALKQLACLIENRSLMRGAELIGIDLPWSGVAGADNLLNLAREVVKINIEALQDTLTLLDEGTLLHAVDTILSAKHVFLIGFGTSAPVIQDAYQRFLRLQVPASICSDAHVLASIAELSKKRI